jgi:hypothetical protein
MLTGQLRSQIDKIWDTFWSGGISNHQGWRGTVPSSVPLEAARSDGSGRFGPHDVVSWGLSHQGTRTEGRRPLI